MVRTTLVSLLKAFDSQEAGKCQINALFSVVITDQVRQIVYHSILYLLKGRMNHRNKNDERSGVHEVLGCVLKTFGSEASFLVLPPFFFLLHNEPAIPHLPSAHSHRHLLVHHLRFRVRSSLMNPRPVSRTRPPFLQPKSAS